MTPHDYPYYFFILDAKSKRDMVKALKKLPNFKFFNFEKLHTPHLLKLLGKLCKYEIDPASIAEDTKRIRLCPQTGRRTDRRTR